MSTHNLSSIVHELVGSDVRDKDSQREFFGDLVLEAERIRAYQSVEVDFLLDMATGLSRFLAEGRQPSLEETQRLVTRLLVNAECKLHRLVESQGESNPAGEQGSAQPGDCGPKMAAVTGSLSQAKTDPGGVPEFEASGSSKELSMAGQGEGGNSDQLSQPSLRLAESDQSAINSKDLRQVKLGDVIREMGLMDSNQIDDLLMVQCQSKQRLGDIIAQLGKLGPAELRTAIDLHAKVKEYAVMRAEQDPCGEAMLPLARWHETLLGELLVIGEVITPEQLNQAIVIQRATGLRIGEVLVQQGMCSSQQVLESIRLQEKLRHTRRKSLGFQGPHGA